MPADRAASYRFNAVSGSQPVCYLFVAGGGDLLPPVGLEEFTDVPARLAGAVDQLAKEFEGIFDRAHVEAVVDESARQLEGAAVASFVPILAHRFARERLRAQALFEGKLAKTVAEVLFVSITGGGRARMAASLLERVAGDALSVHTAGSGDVSEIDPNVRVAMEEVGIDLSDKFTRPLTAEVLASADLVVTMGRSVGAFEIPETARHLDWRVGDPAEAELDEVRRVRADIERRVDELVTQLVPAAAAGRAESDR
jgi:protein-tyrosine-phosphatase